MKKGESKGQPSSLLFEDDHARALNLATTACDFRFFISAIQINRMQEKSIKSNKKATSPAPPVEEKFSHYHCVSSPFRSCEERKTLDLPFHRPFSLHHAIADEIFPPIRRQLTNAQFKCRTSKTTPNKRRLFPLSLHFAAK